MDTVFNWATPMQRWFKEGKITEEKRDELERIYEKEGEKAMLREVIKNV